MRSWPAAWTPICPGAWTFRRPLRSRSRGPSSTGWRRGRRTSSPIPCQRPWRRAGAPARPRRSSASMRRSWQRRPSRHEHGRDTPPRSHATEPVRSAQNTPLQEGRRMDHGMEPLAEGNHRIVVTGGTGTLGRQVVPRLRDAGCKVRVLSRGSREGAEGLEFVTGDLATGEGIDAAGAVTEMIVRLAASANADALKERPPVLAPPRAGDRRLSLTYFVVAGRTQVVSAIDRAMLDELPAKPAAVQVIAHADLRY